MRSWNIGFKGLCLAAALTLLAACESTTDESAEAKPSGQAPQQSVQATPTQAEAPHATPRPPARRPRHRYSWAELLARVLERLTNCS